ncbi:MAG: carboxypeptidase-like regulatory domain-containing protein, partial [Candidatus Methanoperedens sp.]
MYRCKFGKLIINLMLGMLIFVSIAGTSMAIYTIQEFGTDGFRYLNGTDITVSGKIMNESTQESGVNITLELSDSNGSLINSYSVTTDENGDFSQLIPANLTGSYSITAFAPDFGLTSAAVNVVVYDVDSIKYVYASFTTGTVYAVSLNETGYGNITINGTQYNFSVSTGNAASVDDGSTTVSNIVINSRVKLGGNSYNVFFINRSSEIVLARLVQPMFTGTEGSKNLTLITLDYSNHPISDRNLTVYISNSTGVMDIIAMSSTDTNGITGSSINITNVSGIYNIQILENGQPLSSITYSINSYDVSGDIFSADWSPQHTFARGQTAIIAASVKTTAGAIYNNTQANVTANIRGPGGYLQQVNMLFEENKSMFYYSYNVSDSANRGTYNVEYLTTIGTETLKSYGSFDVKGYNLFLKPIGSEVKEQEGFSPGEQGYILVSGTDLGTGEIVNVDSLTSGSNKSNFTLSIKNSEGKDLTGSWDVMSLGAFFSTKFVPNWLQDEINSRSPNASVISLTAPGAVGIYNAKVIVNLNGTTEETGTSFGVQDIFLNAFPVSNDGLFTMSVSSQDNVTLNIRAFNPKEMREETNITAAGIVEAFAVNEAAVVTDKMENPSLISLPGGSKGLRFYNNDTNMGFHMVKFWANITKSDGNVTQAMGTGFFDAKQYLIWASPVLTESGNFRTFSATSDISMRVQVLNTGFSAQSGKQVSIDEVRYGRNWEKVQFDTYNNSANTSGTTDSNGIANLSFTPSNPLKSGWYDVRIKLTTTDASGNYITDYGRGFFEVRNFMFWAHPANWNVKSGENISFNLKAINSTDMGSSINTTVRIKKILHRSDWRQPLLEVTGTHTLNGSSTVNISTNMSQEAVVVYTGGSTTKAGIYEFIFEATDPASGAIEETRSMIETRPFVSWVTLPGGQWNNRFGVNRTISLIVHASSNYGDEANSIVLNSTRTNITSVTKMGMFGGTPYKKRSDLNITNVSQDGDGKSVNITLTLTDWQESGYDMQINAVDNSGSEVITHFWIEVEVATVGLPQFYRVMIPSDRIVTNRTSFYLGDSPAEKVGNMEYPDLTSDVASNFSNAKIGWKNVLGNEMEWMEWGLPEQPRNFYALVNLTEPRKLYINYLNANFSDNNVSHTQNMTEGEIFNELDDGYNTVRHWTVKSISSDGSVVLEGIDSLRNTYIIDPLFSKSGKFIVSPNMQDSEWLKVDLDGNDEYFPQWNNRNNMYYILLADSTTAGIYDTVWISNTTNFTKDGIQASNSNTPVTFGGDPIYFINLMKEGSDYMAQFTSYTTGFYGMWLGTFEKGRPVNIPFLVQEPGSTTGIPNANVTVNRLTWYTPGSDKPISPVSATTNANGLALVSLNTSDIPTGQYLIGYRVELPGGNVKQATENWKMPGIEIRKFVVEAEFGNVGTISTHLLTNGSGIDVLYGTRIEPRGATSAYRFGPNPMIYRIGWPFNMENEYYYNASDGRYYAGFDGQDTTGAPLNNNSINLTRQEANTTYNFTRFILEGTNESITGTVPETVFGYWNISIWGDGTYGNDGEGAWVGLRFDYLLDGAQDLRENLPSENRYRIGDRIFWAPGELNVVITAIDLTSPGTVYFETFNPKILYQSESLNILIDGNESNGEWASGGVTKLSYGGYDVFGYNDAADLTTMNSQEYGPPYCQGCWSPTLDHVLLVNGSNTYMYRVGVPIPELGNRSVGLVSEWASKMIFVNQSLGLGIYPYTDWAPDGDSYYVGTFTEPDLKIDLNYNGSNSDNRTYYIRLEDGSKNGVFNVTRGIFDDDTDFIEAQTFSPNFSGPLDMFQREQGQLVDTMQNRNLEERYLNLNTLHGWPFGVPEVTYNGDYANLTTFSSRYEPYGLTENVTMYLSAKTFSNEPISGNISLEKLVVLFKVNQSDIGGGMGGKEGGPGPGTLSEPGPSGGSGGGGMDGGKSMPDVYTSIDVTSPIVNGIGVWEINYSILQPVVGSFDSGQFVAMLNITNEQGDFEIIERQFMLQNRSSFGKSEFGCPPPGPCGPSGG